MIGIIKLLLLLVHTPEVKPGDRVFRIALDSLDQLPFGFRPLLLLHIVDAVFVRLAGVLRCEPRGDAEGVALNLRQPVERNNSDVRVVECAAEAKHDRLGLEPRETCADLASREIAFTDTTLWTEAPCGVARDRIVSNTGVKKHLGISRAELEAEIAL